jgi:hypothetical protein
LVPRQSQIEKRQIELAMREQDQSLHPVGRLDHSMVHALQCDAERPPQAGFIVDNEDVHRFLVKKITVHFALLFVQIASVGNSACAHFKPEQSVPPPFAFWCGGRHGNCVQ